MLEGGEPLDRALAAMILVHGRGASATDILSLAAELKVDGVAFLAPQAAGSVWYPNPFTAPLESNEPYLSSALEIVASLVARVGTTIPVEKLVLLGFSQGACLALEFAARNARRYGGVVGLSGGLIGPDAIPRDYPGDFQGAPAFLGCSDVDPYIPKERVTEAGGVLERMGASATVRLYPRMAHTVNEDEMDQVRKILRGVTGSS